MAMQTRLLRDVYLSHGSYGSIGLDRYPIFNDSHREVLNTKIVQHYAMREIGFDTDDYFIFELRRKMNEIMPPYNDLYRTQTIDFDPLSTTDMQTVMTGKSSAVSDSTTGPKGANDTVSSGRGVTSETPASQLSENGQYASGISDSRSRSTVTESADGTAHGTDNRDTSGTTRTTGRGAAAAPLIQAYRDIIVNVDMMIVGDLEELFMQVLSTPDNDIPKFDYPGYPSIYGGLPFML